MAKVISKFANHKCSFLQNVSRYLKIWGSSRNKSHSLQATGRDHFLSGPPLCLQQLAQLPWHSFLIPLQIFLTEFGFWNGSAVIVLNWFNFSLEGVELSWFGKANLNILQSDHVLPCLNFPEGVLVVCWCFSVFPLELTSLIYISTTLSFSMFLPLIINGLTYQCIFWDNLSTPLFT